MGLGTDPTRYSDNGEMLPHGSRSINSKPAMPASAIASGNEPDTACLALVGSTSHLSRLPTIALDHAGHIAAACRRFEHSFRIRIASCQSTPLADLVHPGDVPALAALRECAHKTPCRHEMKIRLRNAHGRYLHVNLRAVSAPGGHLCSLQPEDSREALLRKLVRENRRLRILSGEDPMTRLPNRRILKERLRQMIAEGRRGRRFCCAMMDLDGFKALNDSAGHPAGDRFLTRIAGALRDSCRNVDFVARYGGDEFVVLYADCDLADAVMRARAQMFRIKGLDTGCAVRVTASTGLASFSTDVNAPDQLLARADEALYRAKRSGRNRISIWCPSETPSAKRVDADQAQQCAERDRGRQTDTGRH